MDTGVHLQAIHCYEIGSQAIHQKSHVLSIEWLEMSLAKANDGTIGKDTIEKAYQKAIIEHDNTRSNLDPLDDPSYIYEQLLTPIQNHVNFKSLRQAKKQLLINEFGGDSPDLDLTTFVNYWLLCSGADLQSPANKSKLFCWYERKIHPYLYIGPIKMELLGTKPDIVQMYDVIGDGKIQRLTEVARQNLSLSRVVDPSGDALSPVRTSVQSWIVENFHEEFRVLPKIIEILTGLNVVEGTSSEMLQIAAYTFSGHYEIHLDALLTPDYEGEKELGNRMATFMYYLQQPELGGQTAFPQSRVATQPIKGSAVFWYDLLDDGSVDGTTFHGACPVVYGRKWVGNKWIRYLDQQKNRKCGLKPNEWFSIHSATRGKI
ncbi:unnamed protein product [Allacma fusca]|uniref:Fe2OG dioxygenase domain-containing protein n=1 Tax=Allacma fusca TaxID=39272 RepID=A0A8J2NT03_9HEXA|nr:unnamed protein product [Allacma fusca]